MKLEYIDIMYGEPDLGTVDFQKLIRRTSPNDALACYPKDCPQAKPDITLPVYAAPAETIWVKLQECLQNQPRLTEVDNQITEDRIYKRFIQRSFVFRFPDTIDILINARTPETSSLAIYSRSKLGYSDMGTNRRRIQNWLKCLKPVPLAHH
jgi:uncharacterized protein (DUF1499 family)